LAIPTNKTATQQSGGISSGASNHSLTVDPTRKGRTQPGKIPTME